MPASKSISWLANLALLAGLSAPQLRPQSAAPPAAYTMTIANSMMGRAETVYRSGSKALVDQTMPPSPERPKGFHSRTLFDLQTNTLFTWYLNQTPMPCTSSTFSGTWGDPFSPDSIATPADLAKQNAKAAGAETVNGFATQVFEIEQPAMIKLWVESKYGLVVKAQMTAPGSQPRVAAEIKQLSLAAPPASTFVLPADCAAAAAAPKIPTEAERFAAETGGNAADFVNAGAGPGSPNSCTVFFRVVQAGSMEPIATGFQVAVDATVDTQHPASYTIGVGADGHYRFSGGGLHEVTAQIRNGVLRIDNAPPQFDLETAFGNAGSSSALIYRHRFAPQTVLLYVVKNLGNISEGGDWLWVKSGKYATVNAPR